MRPRRCAIAFAVLVLGGCAGGEDSVGVVPTTAPAVTSTVPHTTVATVARPTTTVDPAGSVTLRATGFSLPDLRSGGTGLRLLVEAASPRLTVSRRGGGGEVTACPVAGASAPLTRTDCVDLRAGGTVDLRASRGVELRATGPDAGVDEVSVAYEPATRKTTVATPSRPDGACAASACEVTFSFLPTRAGPFALDSPGSGGRPRFVLTAVPASGGAGSNRMLAMVEGGGPLSIRADLDAVSAASLLHHQQVPGPVAPVTAEILWP